MSVRKTVLITGASGSMGGKARRHLEALGQHELRLFTYRNPQDDPALLQADLSVWDERWVRQFEGVDVVLHMAADPTPTSSWESIQRLDIDMLLNVFFAAARMKVKRLVFASSNWVLAGHRFDDEPLSAETAPFPINPYGSAKLFAERLGKALAEREGMSVICLRIGYCRRDVAENRPGPDMRLGRWGQQMWLSDGDWERLVERAIDADDVPFAVVNAVSDNAGMRWTLDEGERLLHWRPTDRHVPVTSLPMRVTEWLVRRRYGKIRRWLGKFPGWTW